MMAHWSKMASMGPGCTLHGLRKTLGKYLAKEGATPKQSAGILGHDDLDHVELYSKDGAGAARRGGHGEASEAVCLTDCLTRLSTLDAKPCAPRRLVGPEGLEPPTKRL
ncbi:hypothetical protein NKH54_03990 [Mesorhizobium sp. M1004]